MNVDGIHALLFSNEVMECKSSFGRRNIRLNALSQIKDQLTNPDVIFAIVDADPRLICMIDNPTSDALMFSLVHLPGLVTVCEQHLHLLSDEQRQELCNRHHWLCENHFSEIIPTNSFAPLPADSDVLDFPLYLIYQQIDTVGTFEQLIKQNRFKNKQSVQTLFKSLKYTPIGNDQSKYSTFTQQDIVNLPTDLDPLSEGIRRCSMHLSNRLTYQNTRLFSDEDYTYITLSMPAMDAVKYLGEDVANAIIDFHPRFSFGRCFYDSDTIVFGWLRYTVQNNIVYIDELQSDIKLIFNKTDMIDKAVFNKIEYHILNQCIKFLYNLGERQFCVPNAKQRDTLYTQMPGSHIPNDPYDYIPKLAGFKRKVVKNIHHLLDNDKMHYLDLR